MPDGARAATIQGFQLRPSSLFFWMSVSVSTLPIVLRASGALGYACQTHWLLGQSQNLNPKLKVKNKSLNSLSSITIQVGLLYSFWPLELQKMIEKFLGFFFPPGVGGKLYKTCSCLWWMEASSAYFSPWRNEIKWGFKLCFSKCDSHFHGFEFCQIIFGWLHTHSEDKGCGGKSNIENE